MPVSYFGLPRIAIQHTEVEGRILRIFEVLHGRTECSTVRNVPQASRAFHRQTNLKMNEELRIARLKSPLNPLDFSLDEIKSLKELAETDWYLLREYPGSVLEICPSALSIPLEEYLSSFSQTEAELYQSYYADEL